MNLNVCWYCYTDFIFQQPVTQPVIKVLHGALDLVLMTAVVSTITQSVLMNVPVLSCPTLSMCVYVQLELLEPIVKKVSHKCSIYIPLCVCSCFQFDYSSGIMCDADDLGTLENGMVTVSDTVFNTTATYSCNNGYELRGDATRTCLGTGLWSGDVPTCECKLAAEVSILRRNLSNHLCV